LAELISTVLQALNDERAHPLPDYLANIFKELLG
jgi:hypothetical protein